MDNPIYVDTGSVNKLFDPEIGIFVYYYLEI